jgi:hypothetical protein
MIVWTKNVIAMLNKSRKREKKHQGHILNDIIFMLYEKFNWG